MNIHRMTISGVFAVSWAICIAILAADERGAVTNPLRMANRNPAAAAVNPRPQPDLWRNPASLRPADTLPDPRAEPGSRVTPPSATPQAASAGRPSADQPPRTLIQRIRERRLAQLEKQAERLRQLSTGGNQRAPSGRGNTNPNGPENPDLQIDLGVPVDAPHETTANSSPPDAAESLLGPFPGGPPGGPRLAARTAPTELNPPAEPPVEVNVDLSDDVRPPPPKPPQDRVRSWWPSPP